MTLGELLGVIPLALLRVAVFAFGLIWGSFLNVVIYRVPREMSVVRPGSHCPGCGKPIAAHDNVPVLSYAILRGRARCCGARMSPRYPLVELIGGALSLAIFEVIVLDLPGSVSVGRAAAIYTADFSLALGLVAAAFIDAEHMFLPDPIMYGGIVVGVLTASLREMTIRDALVGAAIGAAIVCVPFIFLYKGLLGRTGMGFGDAKLLAIAGAWFGWPGAVFALFAGSIQGSITYLVFLLLGIRPELPEGARNDIAELRAAAAAGDAEAVKLLAEDPLTEREDPFLVRFVQRLFRRVAGRPAPVEEPPPEPAEEPEEGPIGRAKIPFGPFLILAVLELLLLRERIEGYLQPLLSPIW